MKFDKIMSSLGGEVTAYCNGKSFYFASKAAFLLFADIAAANGTSNISEISEQYNKTCQVQQAYYDIKKSWSGVNSNSNTTIIKYLVNNWDTTKTEKAQSIIAKLSI